MHIHTKSALTKLPFFARLSPHVRACLVGKSVMRSHPQGSIISLQGDENPTLKVVVDGWVKLFRLSSGGTETTLAMLDHGHSFDEVPALKKGAAIASAEAISNCTVLHLDLRAICTCKNAFAELHMAVLAAASGHARDMIGQIEQLKAKTGAQRLSDYLVELSDTKGGENEMTLPYGKKVLAGKLGMKPESLSRAFRQLKPFGVHSHEGNIRLGDLRGLRAFSQECTV
ncbi:cyclic nucleotide-binding domain-containing protein [Aliiroseovarius lamellibrachiae]|uniref:cyclic nucleotide-binding domain-containing protein n=1 Tax=Aliiroseovarius lamellibrachiae TaxID=1924933 RepID=UPI001BE02D3D|nr:cyclic nucleotide-binding domain-containing protein [Aliiroseovarius lamellibrachiae]MBT2131930.1 helix-turn-helix domain-containing protein [Aliiroseovarius lamellibrachiae]